MKNEWDFFTDVQQQLVAGKQLVTGYFAGRFVMPFDEQRGLVLDEQGNEYELGKDYKKALTTCIREKQIPWTIRFQERIICFGPGIRAFDKEATYTTGPKDEPIP
jgi:hypothetical protein